MVIDNQVDLNAVEDEADDYTLVIYDPDNTDFFEEDTLKEDGAPGDLEFRWETEKTKRFTITQEKESASITFSPSNEHVGQFYMNVTVYDTYWEKPFTKLRKVERSNHTVMIIFTVENVNNPPGEPKIIEPKDSEFSAGENINFKGKCKDPDLLIPDSKERLTFIWSSDVDGELGSGKEIKSQLSKGKHVVNFTVIDSKKERSFKSFNITVRNRATISPVNCSHEFFDDEDDVLFYYYSLSDEGDKEYRIERGGDFPEYDIFIDILELTSVRDKNYLLINLTVNDDLSLHPESKSYKYRFSIYLVKPGHIEQVVNLKNMKYDSRFFDTLYSLDSSQYYAKFELEDGEITKDGRTLKIRKHLGDLEYGENINSELLSDFSIFATMKVELKQHPTDSFEHVICYDSIGLGSKSAPNPKKIESDGAPSSRDSELNLEFIASMLIIVIAIVVFIVIVIRKRKLEEKASEETLIDTTQAGMGLHMPVPPQPYGPFGTAPIGFPPPMLQPGPPGRPGVPMLPLLPPAPGQIHQPQFPGPGLMQPFSPMVGKGKKKKRSLKKSF
jgi:hypothetical protein